MSQEFKKYALHLVITEACQFNAPPLRDTAVSFLPCRCRVTEGHNMTVMVRQVEKPSSLPRKLIFPQLMLCNGTLRLLLATLSSAPLQRPRLSPSLPGLPLPPSSANDPKTSSDTPDNLTGQSLLLGPDRHLHRNAGFGRKGHLDQPRHPGTTDRFAIQFQGVRAIREDHICPF